ncbi:MAG TPA: hypothetical protein VH206_17505 [Xanthobacteraceae bacterium]|jgi:hypothetical protein|nr:hypothetical protein [Xanthobacteraceae bacterium]
MLIPHWLIILTAIELVGFLIFALAIATAIPEQKITSGLAHGDQRDSRQRAVAAGARCAEGLKSVNGPAR